MGHLTKKLKNAIYDNFGYDLEIQKQDILGIIYYIISNKNNHIFYVYNKSESLKCNLEIIFTLIKYNFGYCEILNCKECTRYKKHKDYQKCKRKCFYSVYCGKRDIYD